MPTAGSLRKVAWLLICLNIAAAFAAAIILTMDIALGGSHMPPSVHNDIIQLIGWGYLGSIAGIVGVVLVDRRREDRSLIRERFDNAQAQVLAVGERLRSMEHDEGTAAVIEGRFELLAGELKDWLKEQRERVEAAVVESNLHHAEGVAQVAALRSEMAGMVTRQADRFSKLEDHLGSLANQMIEVLARVELAFRIEQPGHVPADNVIAFELGREAGRRSNGHVPT